LFASGQEYRTTGVRLSNLTTQDAYQRDLFNQHAEVEKMENIFNTVDAIDEEFGKHTVCLASSMKALNQGNYQGKRAETPKRKQDLLAGETDRQRIAIPYIGNVS